MRRHSSPSANPTTNSYKRLVPGFEAPVNLVYSEGNRSAAVRIPLTGPSPKAKRPEFRSGDALANPYLAFSAMVMAGLDGIKTRSTPAMVKTAIYLSCLLKNWPRSPRCPHP